MDVDAGYIVVMCVGAKGLQELGSATPPISHIYLLGMWMQALYRDGADEKGASLFAFAPK